VASNKNKINDNALKFIQKGQIKKAIREYEKILVEDPNDVRTLLKKGDLLVRIGEKPEAVETYLKVAAAYSQQGFHLKAVAVYKQILKIDDSRIDISFKLADEYQNLGINSDAMTHLQMVAEHYEKNNMFKESLDVLRRIIELDPGNIASQIKLAELYSRDGMNAEAIEAFSKAAEALKQANRIEDYTKVAERLVFHDSANVPLLKELANIYLQRGDTKRALGKLQICFKANPQDLETLNLLAMAFQELNQLSKTVSVFKEMANIYRTQGAKEEMLQVYRRVLELVPDDPEARSAFPGEFGPTSEVGAEITKEMPAPPVTGQTVRADFEIPPPEQAAPAPDAGQTSVGEKTAEQDRESISRLLTETEVYVKYGLQNKAFEHIKRVLEMDATNLEAHDKLKDLYLAAGQTEDAASELLFLAQRNLQSGRMDSARAYVRSLLTVDPENREGLALGAQLDGEQPQAAAKVDSHEEDELQSGETLESGESQASELGEQAANAMELSLDVEEQIPESAEEGDAEAEVKAEVKAEAEADVGFDLDGADQKAEPEEEEEEIAFDDVDLSGRDDSPAEVSFQEEDKGAGSEPAELSSEDDLVAEPSNGEEAATIIAEMGDLDPDGLLRMADEPIEAEESEAVDFGNEPEEVDDTDVEIVSEAAPADVFEVEEEMVTKNRPVPKGLELEDDTLPEKEKKGESLPLPPPPPPPTPPKQKPVSVVSQRPAQKPAIEEEPEKADLGDELEEFDFYMQQNLLDEAAELLETLMEEHADREEVKERAAKLDRLKRGPAATDPKISPDEMEENFDLAAELDKQVGTGEGSLPGEEDFQYSVTDVLSEFKKGVEKVLAKEDSATHFDLGIAYKEMGLLDDAVGEFGVAASDPPRRASALTMIGLCFVEKGQFSEAINRFKNALHSNGVAEDQATAIYFEMGQAYEMLKDKEEALFYYKKVFKRDPKFRDVSEKVQSLIKAGAVSKKDDEEKEKAAGPANPSSSASGGKISYM
jgi:pilus assembly protein FimV